MLNASVINDGSACRRFLREGKILASALQVLDIVRDIYVNTARLGELYGCFLLLDARCYPKLLN